MSIEDIIAALDEQCRSECQAVFQEAEREAKRILEQAEADAEEIRRSKKEKAIASAESEAAALLYSARLRAKNLAVEVKESVLEEVIKRAHEETEKLRNDPAYPELMADLLKEAVAVVGDEGVVHVDPRDRGVAEKALSLTGLGGKFSLQDDLECSGGLVVSDREGRINIVNTFDERLKRAKERLKLDITRILFGEQERAISAGVRG
jgi:V/A-type H+-transporting ATPase subunit E